MVENVVIIGSGCAGMTAAVYTAREGFSPVVIGGSEPGGQLTLTTTVDNYPGFPDGVDGQELVSLMRKQAERFGARFAPGEVKEVDFSSRPFRIMTEEGTHTADAVIVATGACARMLGIKSEAGFVGRGVSTCATCDGPLYKNKDVIVIGGGDTAMEDSLFLTKFAKSVTIVHRRDAFRASKIMQERVLSNAKIRVVWDSTIEEIFGDKKVERVAIKNLKSGNSLQVGIDGVFLAVGHIPNTAFLKGKLPMDENGYLIAKDGVKSGIDGVFIAGDVADHVYMQAVTAAGSGCMAALEARSYLQKLKG